MEYVFKHLRELTVEEKKQLQELTLSVSSYMTTVLADAPGEARCWLAVENGEICGWSLIRWFAPDVRSYRFGYASVLVSAGQRRKGIGRDLIEQALVYASEQKMTPCVFAVNAEQRAFFKACQLAPQFISRQLFPRTYWQNYRFAREMMLRFQKIA